MLTFFPKVVANKAITTYFVSLAVVSIFYSRYAMDFKFMLIGSVFVCTFFLATSKLSIGWKNYRPKRFIKNIFWTAFILRAVWVIFTYYLYMKETGTPFEWSAGDSAGYHGEAEEFARYGWKAAWDYFFVDRNSYSDSGYPFYLFMLYSRPSKSLNNLKLCKKS